MNGCRRSCSADRGCALVPGTSMNAGQPAGNRFQIHTAVRHLRSGGVVAHATEGVWGLACDPFNGRAVARLLAVKRRDPAKGLIVIGASAAFFEPELAVLSGTQRAEVEASWPGPVSWLVPNIRFPWWICGKGRRGQSRVAIRVPGHDQARAICAAFAAPLVSTSANPSGRPSTASELLVRRWFHSSVDYVVPGRTTARNRPSELRALDGRVLR